MATPGTTRRQRLRRPRSWSACIAAGARPRQSKDYKPKSGASPAKPPIIVTIGRAMMIQVPWKRTILALLLFGTAFGYLEAAVVTYLRSLHEPARQRFYPGRPPANLFPLLTLDQLHGAGPEQ